MSKIIITILSQEGTNQTQTEHQFDLSDDSVFNATKYAFFLDRVDENAWEHLAKLEG